jgi:hypothetical protein
MNLQTDRDTGAFAALDEELARLREARVEREELLIDLEETRVSIIWLEAELRRFRGLRGAPTASNGVRRSVLTVAGAVALVATLWVLR